MADNLKLLLVDDNPMVLAMLQQALSSLATVTTATDAADARLKRWTMFPTCSFAITACPGWMAVNSSKNSRAVPRLRISPLF